MFLAFPASGTDAYGRGLKGDREMSHEVSQFTNEQNSIALNRHNCGSERQIVEQPPAGEFTKDIRDNWDKEEFAGASSPSGRDNFKKKLWEACYRLDRAEAINADLLVACKVGLRIAKWLETVNNCPREVQRDIEIIEAAIAKGEKG